MDKPRYVVVKKARGGIGLALVVSSKDGQVLIKWLMGQRYRMTAEPKTVPKTTLVSEADIVRDASDRELALGFPIQSTAAPVRHLVGG